MKNYSMKCPAEGCTYMVKGSGATAEEAAKMMMADAKQHMATAHAAMPPMADEQMMQMIMGGMKEDMGGDQGGSMPTPPTGGSAPQM